MWLEYSSIREKINEMNNLIEENNNLINKLEKKVLLKIQLTPFLIAFLVILD